MTCSSCRWPLALLTLLVLVSPAYTRPTPTPVMAQAVPTPRPHKHTPTPTPTDPTDPTDPNSAPVAPTPSLPPIAPIANPLAGENHITWLTPQQQEDLMKQLPPPPADGSPEDQADCAEVLKAQDARTADDIAEAQADDDVDVDTVSRVITEVTFTDKKFPVTRALLRQVLAECDVMCRRLKYVYKRDRPFVAHLEVKPLFNARGFGYPSSAALQSHVQALVLEQLFPDDSKPLMDRADLVAQSQVVAGVCNPSDINAAKAAAEAVMVALSADDTFNKDLEDAKTEVRRRMPHANTD